MLQFDLHLSPGLRTINAKLARLGSRRLCFFATDPKSCTVTEAASTLVMFAHTALERARRAIVAIVVAVTFAVLAHLLWYHAGDTAQNGDVIGYLRLPVAPFVYALSALCLVAALIGTALVPRALRARPDDVPSTSALEPGGTAT